MPEDEKILLSREIGLAAIKIGQQYLDWANIPGEDRNIYLIMARQYFALARNCGFPVGMAGDRNPYEL